MARSTAEKARVVTPAAMAAATPPYTLPYSLKTLSWDAQHIFNVQNKYSYTGKGRKLGDPCLQCDLCEQWFHLRDVSCVPADAGFVAFQRNYRFSCRVCTQGPEQFELQENTWTSVVLTAIYNLLLTDDNSALRAGQRRRTARVTHAPTVEIAHGPTTDQVTIRPTESWGRSTPRAHWPLVWLV